MSVRERYRVEMLKLFILSLCLSVCSCYKILVVFPIPGNSHAILGEGYVRHLLAAGHEVTYITPLLSKNPSPKLRQVDVSANFEVVQLGNVLNLEKLMNKEIDMTDISFVKNMMNDFANATIANPNVRRLMEDPTVTFDVIIAEWMYTEIYAGFASVFNCPLIWSSSLDPHTLVLWLIDEGPNPAYVADHMSSENPPFTFTQRVKELWSVLRWMKVAWLANGKENAIYDTWFSSAAAKRGVVLTPLDEIKYDGSLMLGNSHVALGQPVRLPQNYIPILGYHIEEKVKPLPENLQAIMDNAKHGVIYFSMGSMLKSKTFPDVLKKELLKVFSGLKQTVLWKFEEVLPNLPKNVHIVNWAPQQSILDLQLAERESFEADYHRYLAISQELLQRQRRASTVTGSNSDDEEDVQAHPNCVLFITHGGLLSLTESVHFGVPVIGIPMFADQFLNINRAQGRGFGLKVDLDWDLPNNLNAAIQEILGKPRYRERVKELSFIYHHRPEPPGAALVHWVEHVIKTNGAPHLRSPALHVPFYQKMYLDLAAVILIVLTFVVYICKSLFVSKKRSDLNKKNK